MSAQSIANFRQKLANNNALQISMAEAINSGPEAIVALGAANGCDFSVSDLQTASTSADLTDFELGLVSGGGRSKSEFFAQVTREQNRRNGFIR